MPSYTAGEIGGPCDAMRRALSAVALLNEWMGSIRVRGKFDRLRATPPRPLETMAGSANSNRVIGLSQSTMLLLIALSWFRIPDRWILSRSAGRTVPVFCQRSAVHSIVPRFALVFKRFSVRNRT